MLMDDFKDFRFRRFCSILFSTALINPAPCALAVRAGVTARTENKIAATTPRGIILFIKAPLIKAPNPEPKLADYMK
jgi:hypothetical protein